MGAAFVLVTALAVRGALPTSALLAQPGGTPTATASCDAVTPMAGTPTVNADGMAMGTPMASMEMEMEADQLYIDMMIPHHASIIAMAEAILPRLTDQRLQEIAQSIITAQGAEIGELRAYRERFYGSPEPMPMDATMMGMMKQMMPGMGDMDQMSMQMDPAAQVAAVCAGSNPDLAFIDATIPHHQMAIASSESMLDQMVHPETKAFAQRVIADQQRELDELATIRADVSSMATPEGS